MDFKEIINLLESGKNCIVYGANNSGKTSLLKKVNDVYIQKNIDALFSNDKSKISQCITIPAKRVFELYDGGIKPNEESLNIDVISNFGKEWTNGSFILGIREKIKRSPLRKKVESMCLKILELDSIDVFDTKCSDGVQNIVNILCYLFHVLNLYNNSEDIGLLLKAKFLLIVDEIELFLYTKSIVNFLEVLFTSFKNINLLISSHSILVMQRINGFEVLKIENLNSIESCGPSPYFNDFGYILTSLYEINEYPDVLEGFISKLDCLLKKNEIVKSDVETIFKEAADLREKYPPLSELIINLQKNFYKRVCAKCNM